MRFAPRSWLAALCCFVCVRAEPPAGAPSAAPPFAERPVETIFEAQVELHRRGFSCGAIDGVFGAQTEAALRAFQRRNELPTTGRLDPPTVDRLRLTAPALAEHLISHEDLADVRPLPPTWLGKSEQVALLHAATIELVAERYRASVRLLQRLNPDVVWDALEPGATVVVPAVQTVRLGAKAAQVVIRIAARELQAFDSAGRLLAHFPVSVARLVEKRPLGELRVITVIPNPNFTFDPAVFPESQEGRELGRKLILPPGPNNPVGLAWIGLDRPGYGIHGTPDPEKVGRTESHGCFRLANWDALTMLDLVTKGTPVWVEP